MIAQSAYALGEREPSRIVAPGDADGVAAALADAASRGEAVVPFGGGTLQGIGNAPTRYDVALDLRGLDAVRAYERRDLTIGVDAGMTVAALTALLADHDQFVPLDVPNPARATIGGVLAAGWLGPRRATYGRPRDLLIGVCAALADGTLAHAGGMVVKNVTGYDVGKLYVGSLGTLGILVRANFKTLPRPPARRLATTPFGEDFRERVFSAVATLAHEAAAMLAIDGFGGDARLVALYEGSEATVERAVRELRWTLARVGIAETAVLDDDRADAGLARILARYTEVVGNGTVTFREPGLPSSAPERSRLARRAGAETIADLRTGDVIARGPLDLDVRATLPRAIVLAGAPAVRAQLDAWGSVPSSIATMRGLKERFDPRRILAPGRFVGGI